MEKIIIRKAKINDLEGILKLNLKLADYHVAIDRYYKRGKDMKDAKKTLKDKMKKRNIKIIVMEKNSKIIGFFRGSIEAPKGYAAPSKIGRIGSAFIEKEYRGKGFSKLIFDEFLKWFKKNGIKHVELSVDTRNKTGKKSWEKLGFKQYMEIRKLDL